MPIVIPKALPAYKILSEENIFVMGDAFYGTVKDGISDSNTGLFDGTTFVSCRYPLVLKSKEDIKVFKEIVDDLEVGGSFEDAARRFVVIRTKVEDLPNLLKSHLDDAEKLIAEMDTRDTRFPDKKALYDVFKGVKAIPANIKDQPKWFKAVRAAQTAQGIVFEPGCIDIGKTAEYQEAYKILGEFDEKSAEPFGVWLRIAGLFQNPKELDDIVQELENRDDYDSAIKPIILCIMQEATADMHLEEFVELNTQPGLQREVLLRGLTERKRSVEEELADLQTEVDNAKLKLRFAKIGMFLLLFALLAVLAGGLWIML